MLFLQLTVLGQVNPRQPENQNNEISTTEWEQLNGSQGNFWAMLPGSPTYSSQPIATAVGDITMHMYVLEKGNTAYFIAHSDYPESLVASSSVNDLLEGAKNGALGKFTSKTVISEEKVKVNGHPAIMSHVKGMMDGMQVTFKGFQMMAENRLYQVYLMGIGEFDGPSADKFIQSFIIDKPGWISKIGDNGTFRFSMPGESTFSSQPTQTAVGEINFNMHMLDHSTVVWFATYSDFPKENTDNNDPIKLLEGSYEGVIKMITERKVLKKEYYKINDYDALKADVTGNMEGMQVHYRGILTLVGNRLYQIYSLSIGDAFEMDKVTYFEESFKLIKP